MRHTFKSLFPLTLTIWMLAAATPGQAQNRWDYHAVELHQDLSWSSDAGSTKSQTLTSTTATIRGTSTSSAGQNYGTKSTLNRVYKRKVEKIGNPGAAEGKRIYLYAKAHGDVNTDHGCATVESNNEGYAVTDDLNGASISAQADTAQSGIGNPAPVYDPDPAYEWNSDASGLGAISDTYEFKARLQADTEAKSTAAPMGFIATAGGDADAKVKFEP